MEERISELNGVEDCVLVFETKQLRVTGENPDALLTDNIFYVRKGVPFVRKNMDGGNFTEENNQIIQL